VLVPAAGLLFDGLQFAAEAMTAPWR